MCDIGHLHSKNLSLSLLGYIIYTNLNLLRRLCMKKNIEGLKFGLLLQFAVGPMCLMVFNTAQNTGFFVAMSLVIAIALVDAFYILLASLGASKLLENEKVEKVVKIVGAIVLMIFGLNIILNVFGINIIPGLNLNSNSSSAFIQGIILTLSNTITIVFWGSILTTKIIEEKFKKKELIIFSVGLVSATLFFLTTVAILGMILSSLMKSILSSCRNIPHSSFIHCGSVCVSMERFVPVLRRMSVTCLNPRRHRLCCLTLSF